MLTVRPPRTTLVSWDPPPPDKPEKNNLPPHRDYFELPPAKKKR